MLEFSVKPRTAVETVSGFGVELYQLTGSNQGHVHRTKGKNSMPPLCPQNGIGMMLFRLIGSARSDVPILA